MIDGVWRAGRLASEGIRKHAFLGSLNLNPINNNNK